MSMGVREAPLERRRGRVVDFEDAGDRLLLEPFLGVTLGDPGLGRQAPGVIAPAPAKAS